MTAKTTESLLLTTAQQRLLEEVASNGHDWHNLGALGTNRVPRAALELRDRGLLENPSWPHSQVSPRWFGLTTAGRALLARLRHAAARQSDGD